MSEASPQIYLSPYDDIEYGLHLSDLEWKFLNLKLEKASPHLKRFFVEDPDNHKFEEDKDKLLSFVIYLLREQNIKILEEKTPVGLASKLLSCMSDDLSLGSRIQEVMSAAGDMQTYILKHIAPNEYDQKLIERIREQLKELEEKILPSLRNNNQRILTAIPEWFDPLKSDETPEIEIMGALNDKDKEEGDTTNNDVLVKVYIKIAKMLHSPAEQRLEDIFVGGKNSKVEMTMEPVKTKVRSKSKVKSKKEEYEIQWLKRSGEGQEEQAPIDPPETPFPSQITDYLRATILCDTVQNVVDAIKTLAENFELTSIEERLFPTMADGTPNTANKVVMVNMVFEQDGKYPIRMEKKHWKGWLDNQRLRMIGEVQVALRPNREVERRFGFHQIYRLRRAATVQAWKIQH